jgi:hypothetical protein
MAGKSKGLTPKQEIFAQNLMKGMSKRDAYKMAGYRVSSDEAASAHGSRLVSNGNVVARLAEMERDRAISERVTIETVTRMLADVYADGRRYKQIGAAATAAMGIAKLHGLLIDRTEDVTRRPARSPDAPLEIEVEHWLTEHKLLPPSDSPAGSPAALPDSGASLGMVADFGKAQGPENSPLAVSPGASPGGEPGNRQEEILNTLTKAQGPGPRAQAHDEVPLPSQSGQGPGPRQNLNEINGLARDPPPGPNPGTGGRTASGTPQKSEPGPSPDDQVMSPQKSEPGPSPDDQVMNDPDEMFQ